MLICGIFQQRENIQLQYMSFKVNESYFTKYIPSVSGQIIVVVVKLEADGNVLVPVKPTINNMVYLIRSMKLYSLVPEGVVTGPEVPTGPDVVKPVTYVVDPVEPAGPVVDVPDGVAVDDTAEPTIIQLWFFHSECILLSHDDKLG